MTPVLSMTNKDAAILTAVLVTVGWCRWIGLGWLDLLVILLGSVAGVALCGAFLMLTAVDLPRGLIQIETSRAMDRWATCSGLVVFSGLIIYHLRRNRRQRLYVAELLKRTAGEPTDAETLSVALEEVEAQEMVKYRSAHAYAITDCYEDSFELLSDPHSGSDTYLLVPRRTRIREAWRTNGTLRLSNPYDCVLLRRDPSARFRVMAASNSPFCQRIMSRIRATRNAAMDVA